MMIIKNKREIQNGEKKLETKNLNMKVYENKKIYLTNNTLYWYDINVYISDGQINWFCKIMINLNHIVRFRPSMRWLSQKF